VDRLSEVLGRSVQFTYTALDRIVLNGYLERLQRPENLVYFFHEVAGVPCIDPSALAARTETYRAWLRRYTTAHAIPLLEAPRGVRKEDFVRPHYARLAGGEGVACVLTSLEQGSTFVSYTPQRPAPAPPPDPAAPERDPDYRRITRCRKRFLHYYFYVFDPVMGPMSLRVASYLPFNVTLYLNGHSFLAQELTRQRIAFRQADNAFLAVADPAALQAAADRLTADVLQTRCDYWVGRLAPQFPEAERDERDLTYRYSLAQVEVATDLLFSRSTPLRALFRRASEIGVLLGGADRMVQTFGRRITRQYAGQLRTVLEQRNVGHPVLRSYYRSSFVKQYEKADRILRTETCLNNTHDLDLKRGVTNLPAVVERLTAVNARYLDLQAAVLASTVDAGQLADLARPVALGRRRIPGIKLHDDRVLRLLELLLHPGGLLGNWTTRDLHRRLLAHQRLDEAAYRLPQLRYDLTKLRAKGLVERIGTSRQYRLTADGIRLGALLVKLRTRLLGPLATLALDPAPHPTAPPPNRVEKALRHLDRALNELCNALGLAA
jgi:hypothetical protein